MFNFEEVDCGSEKWGRILAESKIFDFHHSSFYHLIDSEFSSKLLLFSENSNFIALPVVIRPIPNTPYFDITSVYGYAGPITNIDVSLISKEFKQYFKESLKQFCVRNNIVTLFSRLHPLIDQKNILEDLGEIVELNKTVSIDMTLPVEKQRSQYRKSLKSELNQLRKKNINVFKGYLDEHLDRFIQIYYETMDRVNATPNYYFSKEYFKNFLNNPEFKADLLVAEMNGEIIAGAIFTKTDKIIQYHLAGTKSEYIEYAPMKLILDEARLLYNQTNVEHLHLGGGVGGHDTDSLFRFKSAFSNTFKQFSIWKYIVNEQVYEELSSGKEKTNFFPLYRS